MKMRRPAVVCTLAKVVSSSTPSKFCCLLILRVGERRRVLRIHTKIEMLRLKHLISIGHICVKDESIFNRKGLALDKQIEQRIKDIEEKTKEMEQKSKEIEQETKELKQKNKEMEQEREQKTKEMEQKIKEMEQKTARLEVKLSKLRDLIKVSLPDEKIYVCYKCKSKKSKNKEDVLKHQQRCRTDGSHRRIFNYGKKSTYYICPCGYKTPRRRLMLRHRKKTCKESY